MVVLVAAGVGITGCRGSGTSVSGTDSDSSATASGNSELGYLAQSGNGAAFINWLRSGSSEVVGTFFESFVDPSSPYRLRRESSNFTGTITGSRVYLDLDVGSVWQGSLMGQRLTLWSVTFGRAHSTLHFHPASLAAYKAAVAALLSH